MRRITAIVFALLLGLAACGDSGGGDDVSGDTGDTTTDTDGADTDGGGDTGGGQPGEVAVGDVFEGEAVLEGLEDAEFVTNVVRLEIAGGGMADVTATWEFDDPFSDGCQERLTWDFEGTATVAGADIVGSGTLTVASTGNCEAENAVTEDATVEFAATFEGDTISGTGTSEGTDLASFVITRT